MGDLEKIYIAGIHIKRFGDNIHITEPLTLNEIIDEEIGKSDFSDLVVCRIFKNANPGLLTIEPSETVKKGTESKTIDLLLKFLAKLAPKIDLEKYRNKYQ